MSMQIPGGQVLKPVLDAIFDVGAIVFFSEIILVLYRTVTLRLTLGRIFELSICIFLFALCLDWISGFNFFENILVPIAWNFLSNAGAGQIPVNDLLSLL